MGASKWGGGERNIENSTQGWWGNGPYDGVFQVIHLCAILELPLYVHGCPSTWLWSAAILCWAGRLRGQKSLPTWPFQATSPSGVTLFISPHRPLCHQVTSAAGPFWCKDCRNAPSRRSLRHWGNLWGGTMKTRSSHWLGQYTWLVEEALLATPFSQPLYLAGPFWCKGCRKPNVYNTMLKLFNKCKKETKRGWFQDEAVEKIHFDVPPFWRKGREKI